MSSIQSKQTLSRQWDLLFLVGASTAGKSAAELCSALCQNGYDVSLRTVERDLIYLSSIFPLLSDDSAKPQRWYWMQGRELQLPGISLVEAVMLQLVEGTLKQVLPSTLTYGLQGRFHHARSKVLAVEQSNHTAKLMDKIAVVSPSLPMIPPQSSPQCFDAIQQALTQQRQLQAQYKAIHSPHSKQYCLNPLGLVQRGHITYLVATVQRYTDVRLFALHRFEELTVLPSANQPPSGFSLAEYLASGAMQFGNGETIQLQARISDDLRHILLETPLATDMQITPLTDDWYQLTATVHQGWALQWWILSHSRHIEVLAPLSLRQHVVEQLRATLAHYPELMA